MYIKREKREKKKIGREKRGEVGVVGSLLRGYRKTNITGSIACAKF